MSKKRTKEFTDGTIGKLTSNPTRFAFQLDEEQKIAKQLALESTIMFLTGEPGTSKTFLSVQIALDGLIKGEYKKMIVTRPVVDVGKSMGFLPGEAFDFKEGKMAPYIAPVLQTMYKLRKKDEIDRMIKEGRIEIVPLQFVRGLNFEDCVVILDEGQNATSEELKAVVTRLCYGSKLIVTSDYNQIDLQDKNKSLSSFVKQITLLEGVGIYNLTKNYRHPLAVQVMKLVNREEDERRRNKIEAREKEAA